MGWSLRSWALGLGVLTSLWPPSASGCRLCCPKLGGPAVPAPPPRSPPPDSPAPPRRLDGSLRLVQAPAVRRFGPLTQPPLLIRGLYSAFSQNKRLGLRNVWGRWRVRRVRSGIGVESKNGGRKSVAEDLCTGSCQGGEGVGPEAFRAALPHPLDSSTQLNGR